jgi:hypothetical protein
MRRLIKGYDKLKEFVDRAFAIHEAKFGLPESVEKELKEDQRIMDGVVIDARERFAT